MKYQLARLSLAVMVILSLIGASVATAQEPSIIRVTGSGTAYSTPDIAYLSVGVEVANAGVQAAVDEANNRINDVRSSLEALGISADDVRTENFYLYRETIYQDGTPSDQALFRVSNYLRITVRETETVPQVLAAVLEAGANSVNNVSYGIDDVAAVESEARALALADAEATAAELADLVGASVGEVVSVTEYGGGGFYTQSNGGMGGGGGGGGFSPVPIDGGSLGVSVNVDVTFELVRE